MLTRGNLYRFVRCTNVWKIFDLFKLRAVSRERNNRVKVEPILSSDDNLTLFPSSSFFFYRILRLRSYSIRLTIQLTFNAYSSTTCAKFKNLPRYRARIVKMRLHVFMQFLQFLQDTCLAV